VVLIGICLPFMEGSAPFENLYKVGWPLLLANGILAFLLNVVGMFLIDVAWSLVLTLSGVLKVRGLFTFIRVHTTDPRSVPASRENEHKMR
jgi:hypothetical protein